MTEKSIRGPLELAGFITVTSPQNRTVYIRASAITGILADSENRAGILTDAHSYDAMESQDEVIVKMREVLSRSGATPPPTEIRAHKQDREPDPKKKPEQQQDHAWPPPKADTFERDRSDADAVKSED